MSTQASLIHFYQDWIFFYFAIRSDYNVGYAVRKSKALEQLSWNLGISVNIKASASKNFYRNAFSRFETQETAEVRGR